LLIPRAEFINKWGHLAVSVSATGNSIVYVNGQPYNHPDSNKHLEGGYYGNDTGNQQLQIGYWYSDTKPVCKIADFRIWKTARTADEINANYKTLLSEKNEDLYLNYQFNDAGNTVRNMANYLGEKFYLPETENDAFFQITDNQLVNVDVELDELVRNPCMGWGLYDDAQDIVANASTYWNEMNQYAQYATHLYVRWRWAELEPTEGNYVWNDPNSNFNKLINGALQRGLKLAFRVYYDSDGQHYQATPDYVRLAGAEGRWGKSYFNQDVWSPYCDDAVFQEKLSAFIQAFAEEFDDPDRVDFVDGFNLGYWGEGHDLSFKNNNAITKRNVVRWITNAYGNAFTKVPLVINYHSEIGETNLDWVLQNQDYQLRHDAYGSAWYAEFEKGYDSKYRAKRMIVAESCYWFVGTDKGASVTDGIDFTEGWRNDNTYNPLATSWADVYNRTYNEAATARANTLDMREIREARSWTTVSPDLVQNFISYGGYRFTPTKISFPPTIVLNENFSIGHVWKNSGFGICPNNNKRWNNKYKAGFALIDENEEVVKILVDTQADPADWLMEEDKSYIYQTAVSDVVPGDYFLAVGIADTSKNTNQAGLNPACKKLTANNGWRIIAKIKINEQ
jgi:hypothetical protein